MELDKTQAEGFERLYESIINDIDELWNESKSLGFGATVDVARETEQLGLKLEEAGLWARVAWQKIRAFNKDHGINIKTTVSR